MMVHIAGLMTSLLGAGLPARAFRITSLLGAGLPARAFVSASSLLGAGLPARAFVAAASLLGAGLPARAFVTIFLLLGAGLPAGAGPRDNIFWQFANWTARAHTNESYVCHLMPSSTIITRPPLPLCSEALYYAWGPKGQPSKFWGPFCNYSPHPSVVAKLNQTSSVHGTNTPDIILQDSILTTLKVDMPSNFTFPHCFRRNYSQKSNIYLGHIPKSQCKQIYDQNSVTSPCPRWIPNSCRCKPPLTDCTLNSIGYIKNTCRAHPNCVPPHPNHYPGVKLALNWYWYCGNSNLLVSFPTNWSGICAPIQLKNAITAIHPFSAHRPKRDVIHNFPPLEHHLTTRWHRFWTSMFPHFGVADLWKNVELTHYRLASFVNETIKAVDGIRTELTSLRLMTTQNRMALDILLAEKGGVCAMIGDSCCTFIPTNDNPDGEIGAAVHQMRQIAQQLEHDEHGDTAGWVWFSGLFGNLSSWSAIFSMCIPVVVIVLLFIFLGPCILRCLMDRMHKMIYSLTRKPLHRENNVYYRPARV
ncbi:uncharacterized protein LOC132887170 [Neoarius graeffei]|uniref:uncharacterized protein LOC132887170 n=1 Tax=Neoarius graeffei TaxID=443677 RepID=UPI00298C4774|nr:uncharacterized protein LOC132887170 [Neoarius graeffei]